MNESRPRQHLIDAGRVYPGAWKQLDAFRQARGHDLPDWPEWCYLPMAASYAVLGGARDIARLAALAAWRPTQGIYRYDPALYAALLGSPPAGDIPCEVLHRLPEWCVYIETPGREWGGGRLYGFFAHLEWDAATDGREELRLLLDADAALVPIPIHLGPWPLPEAVDRATQEATRQAVQHGRGRDAAMIARHDLPGALTPDLAPLLSLLLYLCAEAPDIDGQPQRPHPKRTKRGWRLFPAKKPTEWPVGTRIGAALRRAYQQQETDQTDIDPDTGRNRPRAHVRRAHWHTYRVGPGRAERRLKWLPPMGINIDDPEALPSVVRPVK